MVTGKNRANSSNNLFAKRKLCINSTSYHNWLRKTFTRTIISIILIMLVLIIQMLNFQAPKNALNFVEEKLEHNASPNTYIAGAKKLYAHVKLFGGKALEAMKLEGKVENKFILPVDGNIISYFNENIGETSNVSKGLIFSSDTGKNIYSVDDGVIIDIGSNKFIGNYIIIKHKGELLSVYKYLDTNHVELNQRVEKGQVIGTSSEKLLLEVWYRNEAVDPIKYIDLSMKQL